MQRKLNDIDRPQAHVFVLKANLGIAAGDLRPEVIDFSVCQAAHRLVEGLLGDSAIRVFVRNLDREVRRVNVGQGIDHTQRNNQQNQQVLPKGIPVNQNGAPSDLFDRAFRQSLQHCAALQFQLNAISGFKNDELLIDL